jgi:DNA repair protein RadC
MGLSAICDDPDSNLERTSPSDKDLLSAVLNQDGKNDDLLESLIGRFGDLTRVLIADFAELVSVTGSAAEAKKIKAIFDMAARFAAPRTPNTIPLSDCPSLVSYLQAAMGNRRVETLRVLFLDTHNRLIKDQVMWEGTVDEVQIHPREILKRALDLDSSAFVLAHNHPSQIVTPSAADVAVTIQLIAASQSLGIAFHDHLIVSSLTFHSMRFHGTIEPWG